MQKPAILAVLAHPDDESFGLGGTLALYAERGFDVYLVCATRGEAGDVPVNLMQGYNSVADLRVAELSRAAAVLGIKEVHFLGYRDSGMAGSQDNKHPGALMLAPLEEVSTRIIRLIRTLRPDIMITFDPLGGYGHPDHIAVHRAASLAFEQASDVSHPVVDLPPFQVQKLYYLTFPRRFMKYAAFFVRLFGGDPGRWGKNQDIDLYALADVHFPVHAILDIRSVLNKKEQAAACHVSQGGNEHGGGFLHFFYRMFNKREAFMRVFPRVQPGEKLEHDLYPVSGGNLRCHDKSSIL